MKEETLLEIARIAADLTKAAFSHDNMTTFRSEAVLGKKNGTPTYSEAFDAYFEKLIAKVREAANDPAV